MQSKLIFIILFFAICCASINPKSTPEGTINYFYKSLEEKNLNGLRSCFAKKIQWGGGLGKSWEDYKITKMIIYDEEELNNYKKTLTYRYNPKTDPTIGDVEIVVTETLMLEGGKKVKYKFCYWLRKFGNEWLIIDHVGINAP